VAEVSQGGGEGDGGGLLLDEFGEFFGGAEIGLSLANCYFAPDSSGFPVLLRFRDAQAGRSFHPFHRLWLVVTENSVRSENTVVPIIRRLFAGGLQFSYPGCLP